MDKLWNIENPILKTADIGSNLTKTMWLPSGTKRVHISDVAIYGTAPGVIQLNTTNTMLGKYFISGTTMIIDNLQASLVGESGQPLTATASGTGGYFVRVTGYEY